METPCALQKNYFFMGKGNNPGKIKKSCRITTARPTTNKL